MIGNDIVDIKYSNQVSNWKRPGYLEKLFSHEERLLIEQSKCNESMVWRLWSMKESAYKAAYRSSSRRAFNPGKFSCTVINETSGSVRFNEKLFLTHSEANSNSIHSIAWKEGSDLSRMRPFLNDFERQVSSADLYQYLLKKVASIVNIDVANLVLKKTDTGVPEIYQKDKKVTIECSLSHHGRFGGILIYC